MPSRSDSTTTRPCSEGVGSRGRDCSSHDRVARRALPLPPPALGTLRQAPPATLAAAACAHDTGPSGSVDLRHSLVTDSDARSRGATSRQSFGQGCCRSDSVTAVPHGRYITCLTAEGLRGPTATWDWEAQPQSQRAVCMHNDIAYHRHIVSVHFRSISLSHSAVCSAV
jgi:hypothetical protein